MFSAIRYSPTRAGEASPFHYPSANLKLQEKSEVQGEVSRGAYPNPDTPGDPRAIDRPPETRPDHSARSRLLAEDVSLLVRD